MGKELWAPCAGVFGARYSVSDKGRVKSTNFRKNKKFIFLKQKISLGYPTVTLTHGKSRRYVRVHTLVLESFVGPRPIGMQCAHLDGNRKNKKLKNLKWVSYKENASHKKLHGTENIGEANPGAKLTNSRVRLIRKIGKSLSYKRKEKMCKKYGICISHFYSILRGDVWVNL